LEGLIALLLARDFFVSFVLPCHCLVTFLFLYEIPAAAVAVSSVTPYVQHTTSTVSYYFGSIKANFNDLNTLSAF